MKYSDRDHFVASLREFADFIEEKGLELPLDEWDIKEKFGTILYDDNEKGTALAQIKKAVKALGKADKRYSGSYLDVQREFGCITLEFSVNREKVCERVVVGTKEIPQELIPARLVEAHVEEIVEWKCTDSLLAASHE